MKRFYTIISACFSARSYLLFLLLVISGCHQVSIERDVSRVTKIIEATQKTKIYRNLSEEQKKQRTQELFNDGLTRDEAVAVALLNDDRVQMAFDDLGVAKSDVVQAGLYTNPQIVSVFQWPLNCLNNVPNRDCFEKNTLQFDVAMPMTISDFWQNPSKQRIAQKDFEIVLANVTKTILDTIAETRKNYDAVLLARELYKNIERVMKELDQFEQYFKERATDQKKVLSKFSLFTPYRETWRMEKLSYEQAIVQAECVLKGALGVDLDEQLPELTGTLVDPLPTIPAYKELVTWAEEHAPEIQIAQLHCTQAHKMVEFERGRVIRQVNFGPDFQRDFNANIGLGFDLVFTLPIFDQNQAQVARAQFLLHKAQHELADSTDKVKRELRSSYNAFDQMQRKRELNKEIIKRQELVLEECKKECLRDLSHMTTLLHTLVTVYEARKKWYEIHAGLFQTLARLERAAIKKLE